MSELSGLSKVSVHRLAQLLVSCAVLGVGVGLMLDARLGSDGYSALINGIAIASGRAFWVVNLLVGVVLVLMAGCADGHRASAP
ncbi:MAG: hypothetical protein JWO11_3395 [Nocardioides sp.]|nr:hypothetical protein [Nocardioides sp.]